jgi:hypothetical protein
MSYSWALAKWKGIVKSVRDKTLPVQNPELLSDGVVKTIKKASRRYRRAQGKKIIQEELGK